MDHQPHPTRHHDHQHHQRPGSHDQHRVLDLDAEVFSDLDDGFPALAGSSMTADAVTEAPVDLVWASSSLHHVTHPARLL
jgi:hypothetical protein